MRAVGFMKIQAWDVTPFGLVGVDVPKEHVVPVFRIWQSK
jgi:gamma-glutamylcysteine synthetase